jgi:hypothetical protein
MTVLAVSVDACLEFATFSADHPIADAKASFERRILAGLATLLCCHA